MQLRGAAAAAGGARSAHGGAAGDGGGAAVWNERDGDTEPALYPDMPSFLKGKALAALYLLQKE